jgi:hypothetical protein
MAKKKIMKILPILKEWNAINKTGDTTKKVSVIALACYKDREIFGSMDCSEKYDLIDIILNGCHEIQNQLENMLDDILTEKADTKFDELAEAILLNKNPIFTQILPDYVLKIAALFWINRKKEYPLYPKTRDGHFYLGLSPHIDSYLYSRCYSSSIQFFGLISSYATDLILELLRTSLEKTLDFIVLFTNEAIEHFIKIISPSTTSKIELMINDKTVTYYYPPPANESILPLYLWNSIHYSLYSYGLSLSKEDVEKYCMHLLQNSCSMSVIEVAMLLILNKPDELFEIAKIFFRSSSLLFGHRGLRELLYYYLICYHSKNDIESIEKMNFLYQIIDDHYEAFPSQEKQTDDDKKRRLALWRIDYRNMNFQYIKNDGKEYLQFLSYKKDLPLDLKKFAEDGQKKINDDLNKDIAEPTTMNLKINDSSDNSILELISWAKIRFDTKNVTQKHKYDEDITLALKEAKEFCSYNLDPNFKPSIALVCCVIIRDSFVDLTDEDKTFCKERFIEYCNYFLIDFVPRFQDPLEILPYFIDRFHEDAEIAKIILQFLIKNPIRVIHIYKKLWEINYEQADIILRDFIKNCGNKELEFKEVAENGFLEDTKSSKDPLFSINFKDNAEIMIVTFCMLPQGTNEDQKKLVSEIFLQLPQILFSDEKKRRVNYELEFEFFRLAARYILNSEESDIPKYIAPFIESFSSHNRYSEYFLEELVRLSDKMEESHKKFWIIWNLFFDKIAQISGYHRNIVEIYLLTNRTRSLDEEGILFFEKVVKKMKANSVVVLSMAKVLNGIGKEYTKEGLKWINSLLQGENLSLIEKNDLCIKELEKLMTSFISKNNKNIKKWKGLSDDIKSILSFLVTHDSKIAYKLDEEMF